MGATEIVMGAVYTASTIAVLVPPYMLYKHYENEIKSKIKGGLEKILRK